MSGTPLRLQILWSLTELLEGVNPDNGFTYDLRTRVYRGRDLFGEETKPRATAALSILEAPRPDFAIYTGEWGDMRLDQWTLLLQGMCPHDLLQPYDSAYFLHAEVERQLAKVQQVRLETGKPLYPQYHLLGGLITSMEIAPPAVRPPNDQPSATAVFYLPVRVGVAVSSTQPYTA